MYLVGEGGDAQPYPAPRSRGGRGAHGADGVLTPRALAGHPQTRVAQATHLGDGRSARQARHLVEGSKQTVVRLTLKVSETVNSHFWWEREKNVLFNDALNTFYLRLYGVRHMVKDHSDSEKGNPLPPHRLLLSINSKGSFICTIPQTG